MIILQVFLFLLVFLFFYVQRVAQLLYSSTDDLIMCATLFCAFHVSLLSEYMDVVFYICILIEIYSQDCRVMPELFEGFNS